MTRPTSESGVSTRSRRPVIVALLLVGAALLWLGMRESSDGGATGGEMTADASMGPLPVVTDRVRIVSQFGIRERLAGRIVARRRSDLGFDRGGRVAQVEVEEGDRVAAGTRLAHLDTRELEAARRELRARVAATEARLDLARKTADRRRQLSASGMLAPQALDEALSEERALESQLAADRAILQRTEVAIDLSDLTAPYPAVIVRRYFDEGSVASAGAPVLSILELGTQQVNLGVPPHVAGQLEIGRTYTVENGRVQAKATLRSVLPELDPSTRMQTAILVVEDEDPVQAAWAEGGLVWIETDREVEGRGSWVPIGALAESRRGTWTVFAVVADASGTPRVDRRIVEILHTEADRAFVRGTLETGDEIVIDGLHRLIPGLAVRPLPSASSTPNEA